MKHQCNAACTNVHEQAAVTCGFGEAKIWVFHPLGRLAQRYGQVFVILT